MGVDSTTFAANWKMIYRGIQDQCKALPALMNLLDEGEGQKITTMGGRGYTFLARVARNWRMGFRAEGTTGVGTAGNQGLAQATVSVKYAYVPNVITGQAVYFGKGDEKAFMDSKALESMYDAKDLASHCNVLAVGAERGGQLAQVSAAASGSFTADFSSNLPGAIYLSPGMYIDTNAVGGGALTLSAAQITAVNYTSRLVTVAGTAVNGEAVTLSGEAPASSSDFPLTAEGLVSLIASTGSRQGLNPATAGQESWASIQTDVGGVQISSQLMDEQISLTRKKSGSDPDLGYFPDGQANQLTAIATQTLRFDVPAAGAKKALDLGFTTYSYAGRTIVVDKDARQDRTYWGTRSALCKWEALPYGMADDEAGEWTRIYSSSGIADAVAALGRWYYQIGVKQRNAWSVYYNYVVTSSFLTTPTNVG